MATGTGASPRNDSVERTRLISHTLSSAPLRGHLKKAPACRSLILLLALKQCHGALRHGFTQCDRTKPRLLALDADAVRLLQAIPLRGSIPVGVPTDPTIHRFYEMAQIYGSTVKALVHEQFGDGIVSAINFKLDIKKVQD